MKPEDVILLMLILLFALPSFLMYGMPYVEKYFRKLLREYRERNKWRKQLK